MQYQLKMIPATEMTSPKKEVQAHGFLWERQLLIRAYGATEAELATLSYTSPYDLPAAMNRTTGANLSIKANRGHIIDMAAALRIFDEVTTTSTPFHLTLVNWKQETPTTKRVIGIREIDLTGTAPLLFGTVTRAEVEVLDRLIKAVPQGRSPTPEEHAAIYAMRDSLKSRLGFISLAVKCNSTQSRLQCSFNLAKFLAKHPERLIAASTSSALHGGTIDEIIESGPRKFA